MTRTAWLSIVLIALAAGPARAQSGPRVVVFPADGAVTGKLAGAPAAIAEAIAAAGRASGATVEQAAGSAGDAMTLAGCSAQDPGCLGSVAATVEADLVVTIAVAPADTGVFVDIEVGRRGAAEPVKANWLLDGADVATIRREAEKQAGALFAGGPAAEPEPAAAGSAPILPPEDTDAPTGRPAEDRPSRLSRVRAYSWIAAGAGVALIAGGTVFLLGAGDKQDEIDQAPTTTRDDFRALEELEDDASSQALWGNVMLGAGIVAAGVGATLIVLQMRSDPDDEATVSLAPAAFDRGAGLALTLVGDL